MKLKSIDETLNGKIQNKFIFWGVHDILDADGTAKLTTEIIELALDEFELELEAWMDVHEEKQRSFQTKNLLKHFRKVFLI